MAIIRRERKDISPPDSDGDDGEKSAVAMERIKALPINGAKNDDGYDIRECLRRLGLWWDD